MKNIILSFTVALLASSVYAIEPENKIADLFNKFFGMTQEALVQAQNVFIHTKSKKQDPILIDVFDSYDKTSLEIDKNRINKEHNEISKSTVITQTILITDTLGDDKNADVLTNNDTSETKNTEAQTVKTVENSEVINSVENNSTAQVSAIDHVQQELLHESAPILSSEKDGILAETYVETQVIVHETAIEHIKTAQGSTLSHPLQYKYIPQTLGLVAVISAVLYYYKQPIIDRVAVLKDSIVHYWHPQQ